MAALTCMNCGKQRGTPAGCSCIPSEFWEHSEAAAAAAELDLTRLVQLLRSRIDLNQEAIARLSGLSQSTVSRLESGRPLKNLAKARQARKNLGAPVAVDADPEPPAIPGGSEHAEDARWLLAHAAKVTMGILETPEQPPGPSRVSAPVPTRLSLVDIEHLEAMTSMLRSADYQFGGGVSIDAIEAHIDRARKYAQAEHTGEVSQRLRLALADLYNLGGWTTFDIGANASAGQHFAQALVEAKKADSPSLSANILYRIGRLHLHNGRHSDALRFFQLGQLEAQTSTCRLTVSLLCANEAWAYAMLDDEERTVQSLERAEDEFSRAEHERVPGWVRFWGEADLYAMTGVATAAMPTQSPRSYARATDNLNRALALRGPAMGRSRAFELAALATAHLRHGDIDEGTRVGSEAVDLAENLRSHRVIDRLGPMAEAALATGQRGEATELAERIATLRTP